MYALLNNQTDACFIKQNTADKPGGSGQLVNLQISTINEEEMVTCERFSGPKVTRHRDKTLQL